MFLAPIGFFLAKVAIPLTVAEVTRIAATAVVVTTTQKVVNKIIPDRK